MNEFEFERELPALILMNDFVRMRAWGMQGRSEKAIWGAFVVLEGNIVWDCVLVGGENRCRVLGRVGWGLNGEMEHRRRLHGRFFFFSVSVTCAREVSWYHLVFPNAGSQNAYPLLLGSASRQYSIAKSEHH